MHAVKNYFLLKLISHPIFYVLFSNFCVCFSCAFFNFSGNFMQFIEKIINYKQKPGKKVGIEKCLQSFWTDTHTPTHKKHINIAHSMQNTLWKLHFISRLFIIQCDKHTLFVILVHVLVTETSLKSMISKYVIF